MQIVLQSFQPNYKNQSSGNFLGNPIKCEIGAILTNVQILLQSFHPNHQEIYKPIKCQRL